MTEIDDITQQLTRSAANALRAARVAVDRHRQRTGRQVEQARRDREHRLRVFETQLRTTVLQRQLAAKEGNDRLAAELAAIEREHRADELVARWAAAEAHRGDDPALADAWTTRLQEAGIDPQLARLRADELMTGPLDSEEMLGSEHLATDYTDMATDIADLRARTPDDFGNRTGQLDDGVESARLIGIAHPIRHAVGPVSASPQAPPLSRTLNVDHSAEL